MICLLLTLSSASSSLAPANLMPSFTASINLLFTRPPVSAVCCEGGQHYFLAVSVSWQKSQRHVPTVLAAPGATTVHSAKQLGLGLCSNPGSFHVEFAYSPCAMQALVLTGCSGFLPLSEDMHIRLIGKSELSIGVRVDDCLLIVDPAVNYMPSDSYGEWANELDSPQPSVLHSDGKLMNKGIRSDINTHIPPNMCLTTVTATFFFF